MQIGIPTETRQGETRVAATPESIKRLISKYKDVDIIIECGAGEKAGFSDADYNTAGAGTVDIETVYLADIILKITPPTSEEAKKIKANSLLMANLEPFSSADLFKSLASSSVNAIAMERIPRISRAQAMDTLSSQANISGYKAVLEATQHLNKFMPVMMTAAGSSKPSSVIILGVGVAGLQAIATAKRLGARVSAFDVRPEVKEQVESLGAKFIKIDLGESGSGEGGYAKELSDEAKQKQQDALQKILKTADVVITTAQIPARPAPVLITAETVKGMASGSVVVDMAAGGYNQANNIAGGNCPLTKADEVIVEHGVTIVGHTNYPTTMAYDASNFFARNLLNLLNILLVTNETGQTSVNYNMEDEVIAKSLVVYNGAVK